MNTVKVRNIVLGEGMPKICVPVTGRTKEEISLRLEEALGTEADLLEWRADWYEQALEKERLLELLDFLRPERKFPSLEALKKQMQNDVRAAEQIF